MSARNLETVSEASNDAAASCSESQMARKCECGNHTHGAAECDACRERPAISRDSRPRRPAPTPPTPPDSPGISFARVRATLNITDPDPERAALTRELITRLAAQLGISAANIDVRVDADAARRTNTRSARALNDRNVVYLKPDRYDPRIASGRYLLAHEAAHLAQRASSTAVPDSRVVSINRRRAELEAHLAGEDFAAGRVLEPVRVPLPFAAVAADSDIEATAPDKQVDPSAELAELDAVMASGHRGELARIHSLLSYSLFDWAITDEDVRKVLTILSEFNFMAARSLVVALTPKDRDRLLDNLDTTHYQHQRTQVLAAFWGCKTTELAKYRGDVKKAFGTMDLRQLAPLETLAANYTLEALDNQSRTELLNGPRGPILKEIQSVVADKGAREDLTARELDEIKKARKEEQDADDERKAAAQEKTYGTAQGERSLDDLVRWIKKTLSKFWVRDRDALAILDALAPLANHPVKLRAVADRLVTASAPSPGKTDQTSSYVDYEEKDYVDKLIHEVPIKALYTEGYRRRVFFRLLTFRPPYKNEWLAEDLVDTPWFWVVSSEDAYLAYQLVRAMPERARKAFYDAKGGANWSMVLDKLPPEMRKAEDLNLYTGGKDEKDRQSIQTQLLDDALWQPGNTDHLEILIRMAIAAGEHKFVFDQSEHRAAWQKPWLKKTVANFMLYDRTAKDAQGRVRDRYYPEILKGTPWYREGVFGKIQSGVVTLVQLIDFILSSDDVEVGSKSVGGRGLNLAELQDVMGGSIKGIEFARQKELGEEGRKARKEKKGVNFADVRWDLGAGILELDTSHLEFSAIRLPLHDLTFEATSGSIRDFHLRLKYAISDKPEPSGIIANVGLLSLKDLLLVQPEAMKGAKSLDLNRLNLTAGKSGAEKAIDDWVRARRGSKTGVPIIAPILDSIVNIISAVGFKPFGLEIVKAGTDELAEVAKPRVPMEFAVSFGSLKLAGVTTSGGQFIQSIDVVDVAIRGGGDPNAYRLALAGSQARLERRLSEEQKAQGIATDPDEKQRHHKAVIQLQRQLDHITREFKALADDEIEVAKLEDLKKNSPDEFARDPANQARLRKLKARLAGSTLDVGAINLKGIGGISTDNFSLTDVHGQGRSAALGLDSLLNVDTVKGFILGEAGRPVVKGLASDQVAFSVDVGHVELPNIRLKGAIPSARTAEDDYNRFKSKDQPWRQSYNEELARLKHRWDLAKERDALLENPGISNFDGPQSLRFSELSTELDAIEDKAAPSIARVAMEGTSLTFGQGGSLAVGADDFLASDINLGSTHINSISGSGVEITVDVGADLSNLADWRTRLKRLGLRGKSVVATGIQVSESGLEVDRATLMGLDDLSLARATTGESTAHLKTQLVLVQGIRLRNMESMLIPERDYLRKVANPDAKQSKRLAAIESKLAVKEKLRKYLTDAEIALAKAKTKKTKQAAQEKRDRAQHDLDRWAEGFIAESFAISGADVDVTGLGDVLSAHFDPAAAMATGITIEGRGGSDHKRIFEKAVLTNASVPGLSNAALTVGPTSGQITTSNAGTRFKGVHLDFIDVDGLDWRDGARRAFSRGTSQVIGIDLDAFVGDDQILVSRLSVASILADQLGYEDDQSGMSVLAESGGLDSITAVNLTIDLPREGSAAAKIAQGNIDVDRVENLRFNALVQGIRAKGKLTGTGLHVDFVTDRKTVYRLDDLSMHEGEITRRRDEPAKSPISDRIHLHFNHLRGTVTQEALDNGDTKYTLSKINLGELFVGKSRWSDDKGRTIEVRGFASLRDSWLDAEVIQAGEKEKGRIKQIKIIRFGIGHMTAQGLHIKGAISSAEDVAPDPKKTAADVRKSVDVDLASATVLGLEIEDVDLALPLNQMQGSVTVRNHLDIQNLRVAISENGKQSFMTRLSVRAHGKESANEGMRGRELRATLMGPKGQKYALGTIEKITGDVDAGGAVSAFATGMVTMSPIEVSADGTEAKVADVEIKDVNLTKPTYKDGKGTSIELNTAHVTAVHLQSLVARFGELTDTAGKRSQGMTNLEVAGLKFDMITAKDFTYTGKTTVSAAESHERTVTAVTAELRALELTTLSHDFNTRVTRLNAKLAHTDITGFAVTLSDTLDGVESRTKVSGNIEAGAMHSELTLTGMRTAGQDWTGFDGYFELTDPAKGLGLSNVSVKRGPAGKEKEVVSILKGKTGGFDLTGLKVKFNPNGTLFVTFDELAASNLKVEIGGAVVEVPIAKLKDARLAIQNQVPTKAFEILGGKLKELEVSGIKVTYVIDRGAPSTGSPSSSLWRADPLRNLSGAVTIKSISKDAIILVPIDRGSIDFDKVRVHKVVKFPVGIDRKGIYFDHVYREYLVESDLSRWATLEQTDPLGNVLHRGSLNLARLIEAKLNEPPSGGPAAPLSALNDLQLHSTDLQLGEGEVSSGSSSVTLAPKSASKNVIKISGVSLGTDLQIEIPEFLAGRADFEILGKKGEAGKITANIKVTVEKLGSPADPITGKLTFTITLSIEHGTVTGINYGNVTLVDETRLRARPGPPVEARP